MHKDTTIDALHKIYAKKSANLLIYFVISHAITKSVKHYDRYTSEHFLDCSLRVRRGASVVCRAAAASRRRRIIVESARARRASVGVSIAVTILPLHDGIMSHLFVQKPAE